MVLLLSSSWSLFLLLLLLLLLLVVVVVLLLLLLSLLLLLLFADIVNIVVTYEAISRNAWQGLLASTTFVRVHQSTIVHNDLSSRFRQDVRRCLTCAAKYGQIPLRMRSKRLISLQPYASIRSVIATISVSFLYLQMGSNETSRKVSLQLMQQAQPFERHT